MFSWSKNIILTGLFCLVTLLTFAGEKSIKFGTGYKQIHFGSHEQLLHSGRYFHGGYSYQFGDLIKQQVHFQISNSNREVEFDLPYVSASTGANLFYSLNFRTFQNNVFHNHTGFILGNDFTLNFFPRIDNQNFMWENQIIGGISSLNCYKLSNNRRIDFNFRIPIYSTMFLNRINRLTSEVPGDMPVIYYSGSLKYLMNTNFEVGYIIPKFGAKLGVYYQGDINSVGQNPQAKVTSYTHSISLRVLYK